MAGWNDLPKELKWMILKHLIYECFYPYNQRESLSSATFRKSWKHHDTNLSTTITNPRSLWMYELFLFLSRIDKNCRKILQSHSTFDRFYFKIKI